MVTTGFLRGEHFEPAKEIPDLEGQVYIVTGGTKGIGLGIVTHLLARNAAKIIMLSSSEEGASKALDFLKKHGDTSRVTWQKCNLRDLKETDKVGKTLRDQEPRIDSLVLNGGIGVGKFALTEDGIDAHFQINVLSQLHLALLLLPILKKTSSLANQPSRLIMMSSEMHRLVPWSTKFESIQEININVGSTFLYSRSKLAQILVIREMARRVDQGQLGFTQIDNSGRREILINATHPGGVRTAQQEQMIPAYGWLGWLILWLIRPFMVDPIAVGCLSGLFAATPNARLLNDGGIHGQYIIPDKQVSKPSGKARNEEMGRRLWALSMALLQDRLGELDYAFELQP